MTAYISQVGSTVRTKALDQKVLAGLIRGAKSPIAIVHELEDPMGYYFKPSDKPPVKDVLVWHVVAFNVKWSSLHSTATCFLSSHKDAEAVDKIRFSAH
jgi:hypothetical protein